MLSILLPTYNDRCDGLVRTLAAQCASADGLAYEILVGDDGSTDQEVVASNRVINTIPGARFIERGVNVGRAAIRNWLACEAQGDWLLFIDSDMRISTDDYIIRYRDAARQWPRSVIYGSYTLAEDPEHGLRYRYEAAAQNGAVRHFCSSNFMIRRDLFLAHPFDETWKEYGYEDVLFCKNMETAGIPVVHGGAPVVFTHWEGNASFMNKTEEALRVLWRHRDIMRGCSRLLELALTIRQRHLTFPFLVFYKMFGHTLRQRLVNGRPSAKWFQFYRLLYLLGA